MLKHRIKDTPLTPEARTHQIPIYHIPYDGFNGNKRLLLNKIRTVVFDKATQMFPNKTCAFRGVFAAKKNHTVVKFFKRELCLPTVNEIIKRGREKDEDSSAPIRVALQYIHNQDKQVVTTIKNGIRSIRKLNHNANDVFPVIIVYDYDLLIDNSHHGPYSCLIPDKNKENCILAIYTLDPKFFLN